MKLDKDRQISNMKKKNVKNRGYSFDDDVYKSGSNASLFIKLLLGTMIPTTQFNGNIFQLLFYRFFFDPLFFLYVANNSKYE